MTNLPFCGQSYTDRTLNANAQRSVNLYPMTSPTPEYPKRVIMYPTPGYQTLYDIVASSGISGVGAIRGVFELNGTAYIISGSALIKLVADSTFSIFTPTLLGTLLTATGRCSIECNTVQLAISDGSYGYTYTLATAAFAPISTTGSFPVAGGVTNFTTMDGYIIGIVNGTKQVIHSNVLDATTFPTQAFDNLTSYPDNAVAVFSDQIQLYAFGPKLTEVQYDAGTIPYAFQKVQGVLIQAGCAAWATLVKVGPSFIWLASDAAGKPYVAALVNYNPKVISTPPINEAFERYSQADIAAAFAYTYCEGDNQFYVITFPRATWAYDLKMQAWHERSINGGRDLPDHYITWLGHHVVGDSTGKLYLMSQDYSTDASGNGLTRIRTCQHAINQGQTFFFDELQIVIESGVGLLSGQGSDPLATLEISRDGGHTWVNVGTAGMGKIGEYAKRLIWRRIGRIRETLTLRLTITDPVRTYILGARAKLRPGTK